MRSSIGVTYPDRFAAIAPSTGWSSFWSYAGGERGASGTHLEKLVRRAAASSDTLEKLPNCRQLGVYILHGEADDNVPVAQARLMRDELSRLGISFSHHEQQGAGHWWDASAEPGADCVDWPDLFDFLARHRLPQESERRRVQFTTVDPGVSAWCGWAGVLAQVRALEPSRVDLCCEPDTRRFVGTTENVSRLGLRVAHLSPGKPLRCVLDGESEVNIAWPSGDEVVWLSREADGWKAVPAFPPGDKGPQRGGLFKSAFNHDVTFVYGTGGTAAENAWAYAKACYDAETLWYRGNAAVELVPDVRFDAQRAPDRGVILFGHAEMNRAWPALLADSPVQVRRGALVVGSREVRGMRQACLFVRPRPGSTRASVGVVAGTGLEGLRLTDRLPYFVSGVAYPDLFVVEPDALRSGVQGVVVAGFFGTDWSVQRGEFAWRE